MWLGGGAETDAVELVNTATALQLSTVHLCEDPGRERFEFAPATLLQNPTGKILDTAHPLSYLLGQEPNPEMDIGSETVRVVPR
jgi:hypothetical protein